MLIITLLSLVTLTFHGEEVTKEGLGLNTCTAVMVAPQLALTAGHCLQHVALVGKLYVEDDKTKYKATYVDSDMDIDLALIKLQGKPHNFATLGVLPHKGDKIYTLNSGDDMVGTYNEGIVCNLIKDSEYHDIPMVVHNAVILQGASGSGIFDSKGQLLGINVLSYEGLSEAVDIVTVKKFLKKNHVL